jgi:hypothetical protein
MGVWSGVYAAGEKLDPGSAESGQFLNLTDEELSGLSDAMDLAESVMDRKTEELDTTEEEELSVSGGSTDDAPDYMRVDEVLVIFFQGCEKCVHVLRAETLLARIARLEASFVRAPHYHTIEAPLRCSVRFCVHRKAPEAFPWVNAALSCSHASHGPNLSWHAPCI